MDPSTEVNIISTCTIEPSKKQTSCVELPLQRCELTPWDLIFLTHQHAQKGLLFHKPQLVEDDDDSFIHRLKTSLSHTLDYFIPLAGRLAFTTHDDDVSTSFFIDCNGAGAQFIHATANVTMSDILDTFYVPHIVYSFFPLTGAKNYDGCSQPLLAVQVTELVDAVFVGCSINHAVVDGSSFWHFFNTWSDISRGRGSDFMISNPPILNRRFPNGDREGSLPIRLPFSPNHFVETYGKRNIQGFAPLLEEVIICFSRETILSLKEKANTECGFTNKNKISSLQSLLAHVWRSVTRARKLPSSQETRYFLSMGSRTRLQPPLPEYYMGNSVLIESTATTTAGELLERDLGWAALMLNRVVESHTDGVIRRSLESWVKKPVFTQDVVMKSGVLWTGSSPRFDMYGNDFGWGSPVAVRSGGAVKLDGKITASPGVVEGSIEMEICLAPEILRDLFQDSQFMEVGVKLAGPNRSDLAKGWFD